MVSLTRLVSTALSLCSITQGYVIKVNSRDGGIKKHEHHHNLTVEEFLRDPHPVEFHREIKERDGSGCEQFVSYGYEIIGDGNPHQNYKIAQIANTLITCAGGTTSTGQSHTFGWSIGGGFNPGAEKYDFASVGFDVSESNTETVTQSFNCNGNDGKPLPGATDVCVLHYTAYTAVNVNFQQITKNCASRIASNIGTGVVYLPNDASVGSVISRGINFGEQNIIQCRGQDEREVDFFCGPKGGPEFWTSNGNYGPWDSAYRAAMEPPGCAVPIEANQY